MFGGTKALVQALVAEKAINAELRTALARAEAHFDWLASHVNELKAERAALLERTLGLQLAVPTIQRVAVTPSDPLPGADPLYTPGKVLNIGDVLARAREIADVAKHGGPEPSIASPGPAGIDFEDMGDDAAARAGLRHAADGTVVSAR
jgi:hypothetical protein